MTDYHKFSDERLIQQAVDRNEDAWTELLRRYDDELKKRLRNRFRSRDESVIDELAQEVWLRVIRKLADWEPKKAFVAWLFTIAGNVVIDEFRKNKRRGPAEVIDANAPDKHQEPLFKRHMNAECDRHFWVSMWALSEYYRCVIFLHHFQDLQCRDIAKLLETTEVGIKSALVAARIKLAEVLPRNAEMVGMAKLPVPAIEPNTMKSMDERSRDVWMKTGELTIPHRCAIFHEYFVFSFLNAAHRPDEVDRLLTAVEQKVQSTASAVADD